jgi:hypothetical protein
MGGFATENRDRDTRLFNEDDSAADHLFCCIGGVSGRAYLSHCLYISFHLFHVACYIAASHFLLLTKKNYSVFSVRNLKLSSLFCFSHRRLEETEWLLVRLHIKLDLVLLEGRILG